MLDALGTRTPSRWRLIDACAGDDERPRGWLSDRKNARVIPHRLKTADYVPFRNAAAKDGLWKIDGRRQVIYVQQRLSERDRQEAVAGLQASKATTAELR